MQEVRQESFSSPTLIHILVTTLSFSMMGAISGTLAGIIDAMRSSGVYVLMSSTSLHLVMGSIIGLLIGLIYSVSPKSFGVQNLLLSLQHLISPPAEVSDYQRGRTVSSIWLWVVVINFLVPLSAQLGLNLSESINTPLLSKLVSTALIVMTSFMAIPFVYSLSHSGGRLFEMQGKQLRHLTSHVPSALHPILLVASIFAVLKGLSIATPPVLSLIKGLNEPLWSILSIAALGFSVAGILWAAGVLLTGTKFKGAVAGILNLFSLGQGATNPILHLTLAGIVSIYHFVMWILSSPPEWETMRLHHAVLLTLFFLPLIMGGEYLKPFVRYSRKWVLALFLISLSSLGYFGLQSGLGRETTRKAIYTDTTSSSFILGQIREFYDQDRDGFANALGEIDCDDNNPNAYPGAYDIPGNDVDEDCDGFDLSTTLLASTPISSKKERQNLGNQDDKDQVRAAKSLFDRIEGPHHIIWLTLPGLSSQVLEIPSLTPEEIKAEVEAKSALAPNLRAWADESLWLSQSYAPTSDKLMSLFSILTGRYPSELIRNTKTPPAFSKAMRTLPETLERSNYQTAAFINDQMLDEDFGYGQGFKVWDNLSLNKQKRRLKRKESPFVRLLERLDLHLKELSLAKREYAFIWLHSDELMQGINSNIETKSKRTRDRLIKKNQNNYAEAVRRLDVLVPQLRALLKSRQNELGKFTVVVSGVHGVNYTGIPAQTLHEDWLKTSSFIYSSELTAKRIDGPSRLTSLTSTILDFAEVETFDPSRELMNIHDKGIVPWGLGDPIELSPIYAEYLGSKNNLSDRIWIKDGWKLKDQLKGPRRIVNERLYWLKKQGENRDRKPTEETRFRVMRRELDRFDINTVRALPKLRR